MSPDVPGLTQQIAHFEDRLRHDPQSRAFLPLADLYRRRGQLAHARDLLQEGLQRHPGFVTARVALALVLTEMEAHDPARDAMNDVLEADPDNLLALRLLLADARRRQDSAVARELAERLIRLAPDDRHARALLQQADPTPAPAVAPVPTPAPMATRREASDGWELGGFETPTLAELYLRQGHLEKARVICQRILALEPDREDARRILARVEAHGRQPAAVPSQETVKAQANGKARSPERGEPTGDLDRFRAWLDAAAGENSDAAG